MIQLAAKRLDHHIMRFSVARHWLIWLPRFHLNASAALRCHPSQRRRIINPKAYRLPTRGHCAGEPPAHADIAKIINDATKNIPAQFWHQLKLTDFSAFFALHSNFSQR
jgi:hypothetical protein